MPPHGSVAASKCFRVRADDSAASLPFRSNARSYVPPTHPAAAVNSCRTRPALVLDSGTPPFAARLCPASGADLFVSSPVCRSALRNPSSAPAPRRCDSRDRQSTLPLLARSSWASARAAAPPRVGLTPPPPPPLHSASYPMFSYRLGRHLAASPLPLRPCPDPLRAPPCGPSACARPSSWRSVHPHPLGFSTPCWTSFSYAYDPIAPGLRASASLCQKPSPIHTETRRNSLLCPVARSIASPRWPPAWSHRSQSSCP